MPQARGDSLLQLTENHETLIRKASEHAVFATTVENNSKSPMNPLWTETVLLLLCREYSEPRKSQNSRLQAVLTDHVKIGPVTGIEVLKSAGTLVIEVQVPSQQPGNKKAWVRKSRGIDQYARQLILTETDHQHPEAVPSQQSMTCGRPQGNWWKFASHIQRPKLTSIGLSQRVWKLMPAETFTQRDSEFEHISWHVTKILRHGDSHEADGAVRWDHVLANIPSAEQTLYWKKESGLMHFAVLLTKSEWSVMRIKTGRLFTFAQYKHTVMVPESIQLCRYH